MGEKGRKIDFDRARGFIDGIHVVRHCSSEAVKRGHIFGLKYGAKKTQSRTGGESSICKRVASALFNELGNVGTKDYRWLKRWRKGLLKNEGGARWEQKG